MSQLKKYLLSDTYILYASVFALLSNFFAFVFIFFQINKLPPQIPFFYSRPWGEEQLAPPVYLIFLPIISFLFYIINLIVSFRFSNKDILLSRILLIGSLVISVLSFIASFRIINLIS
jgi:hypothetical protein